MNYNSYMLGLNPLAAGMACDSQSPADPLSSLIIGYAYVPYQKAEKLYCESEALKNGTAFPELNKPIGVYGREFCSAEK